MTFGSLGMQEFILNWVTQVRAKRLGPFLVGALDDGAAQLCESTGIPAVSFGALLSLGPDWLPSIPDSPPPRRRAEHEHDGGVLAHQ